MLLLLVICYLTSDRSDTNGRWISCVFPLPSSTTKLLVSKFEDPPYKFQLSRTNEVHIHMIWYEYDSSYSISIIDQPWSLILLQLHERLVDAYGLFPRFFLEKSLPLIRHYYGWGPLYMQLIRCDMITQPVYMIGPHIRNTWYEAYEYYQVRLTFAQLWSASSAALNPI